MKPFTRRAFMQSGAVVGVGAGVPAIAVIVDRDKIPAKINPEPPPCTDRQELDNNPVEQTPETVPRAAVSVAERVTLPFGVWVGLGIDHNRKGVVEVDYYGYERFYLSSGTEIAGGGGFYRIITTVEFPGRQRGTLTASHLLVFDSDFIDAQRIKPLMSAIPLPSAVCAPARRIVQIRDLSLDLHCGLRGDWRDDDALLSRRLKRRFQEEALATA